MRWDEEEWGQEGERIKGNEDKTRRDKQELRREVNGLGEEKRSGEKDEVERDKSQKVKKRKNDNERWHLKKEGKGEETGRRVDKSEEQKK